MSARLARAACSPAEKTILSNGGSEKDSARARLRKWLVPSLAATCAVAWLIAAVRPLDQEAWILENLLLVAFVIILFFGHRRLQLSNTSYCLLAAFVLLHIIGAHYTYAQMPAGLWARDYFGFSRNHYDRFAHGAFGFLLAFPVRELLLRFSGIHRRWSYWLAPACILAASGIFEVMESAVAEIIAPGEGVAWLGGQGDEWDAQNDMLAAGIGTVLMMALVALSGRRSRKG
jgi:putative membrane protein